MTKRRTTQRLAQLKNLADQAAENLYERIKLASEVLEDLDWIAECFGGSDLKAMDTLQADYFRDLGGFITMGELIRMYKTLPKHVWEECRYNVAAVQVEYKNRTQPESTNEKKGGGRPKWKEIAEEAQQRIETLERQVEQLLEANQSLRAERDEWRQKAEELESLVQYAEPVAAGG